MIALFAYNFEHRKTHDFIVELMARIGNSFCVLAAPAKSLSIDKGTYYLHSLQTAPPIATEKLCKAFEIPFHIVEHENAERISDLQAKYGFTQGLIAGARIIPVNVINIFSEGIINLHPGRIPDTSGLDAFYYTIENNAPAGITAHFIDARVDAGGLLFFEPLLVGLDDTPEVVNYNNYQLQIKVLRKLLDLAEEGKLKSKPLCRPSKNSPMRPEVKNEILQKFSVWRASQYLTQQQEKLFKSCKEGQLDLVRRIIDREPSILEARTSQGWTPLVLAAYGGHRSVVEYLLSKGANPNACGLKGTTVLMYAKTRLIHNSDSDLTLIKLLVDYGADLSRCDMYGRTVFDYVRETGDKHLLIALESLRQ